MRITVLGAGTWGTALAILLKEMGNDVTLWSAISDELEDIRVTRTHKNLPGAKIPDGIVYEKDIAAACRGREIVLFVVASKYVRATANAAAPHLSDGVIVISAAKGLEKGTLMTMTDIIESEINAQRPDLKRSIVALSGPTHAEEVACGLPTSIVAASTDERVATVVAELFRGSCIRAYTNTDVLGVELAGTIKNVIAIASGINRGMGFGDNSQAMLITRGAAEMTRVGLAMGCRRRTFMGLAGIGDLIVTCTSQHSRNNRCGEMIGRGMTYDEASREIGMVVEGYHALEAAMALKEKCGVSMPITEAVYDVIFRGTTPSEAMSRLMSRDIKNEIED